MQVCVPHSHGFNACALALKGAVLKYMPIVNSHISSKSEEEHICMIQYVPKAKTCISHKVYAYACDIIHCFSTACDHKKVTITLLQADVDEIKQEYDSRHTNSAYTIICKFALNHSKIWRENLSVRKSTKFLAYAG
jgi:hypothetical protein